MPATYTATNADAAAVAQRTVDRLATVTGIAGLQNPVDINTTNGGQIVAVADSYLNCLGYQATSNNSLSANNTSSTSFVDVPGTSITFTAPVAKIYLVHSDFSMYLSAGTGPFAFVRLVVNGSNGPSLIFHNALNFHIGQHLMHAAACTVGSNTIKLQWMVASGTYTANINTDDHANYIITG